MGSVNLNCCIVLVLYVMAAKDGCNINKRSLSRKEMFQPHLPVRLPCYDLAPITNFTLGRILPQTSGTLGFHGLTGGVYKARERIHRAMADARLLANPASRRFGDWLGVTTSQLSVPPIVTRVSPRT